MNLIPGIKHIDQNRNLFIVLETENNIIRTALNKNVHKAIYDNQIDYVVTENKDK